MTDPTRPTDNGTGLNAALRSLVDHAADEIPVPPGPPAVYERARRHRTRRRLGATAAVAAVVVSAGLWVLPPILREAPAPPAARHGPGFVSAASILPSATAHGDLGSKFLLSPAALPWNGTYHWHTATTSHDGSGAPLAEAVSGNCRLAWFSGSGVRAQIARTYAGLGDAAAQHRIAVFTDESAASDALTDLTGELRACGWHETRSPATTAHGAASERLYEFVLASGPGTPLRATLVQSGSRGAVLVVATEAAADHAHADPRTDKCLSRTLDSPSATPSANSTGHC